MTVGKPDFIQIMNFDEKREKAVRNQRMRMIQEQIWKQTGFRWIAEALAGGDLSNLGPAYFMAIMSSSAAVEPRYSMKEFADKLKQRLKAQRPVIVGHNLFTDLIYFCNCFFGPLPERAEDFQAMAHEMFPILMDTKYMATHDCGSINPISSLSEINDSMLKTEIPRMSKLRLSYATIVTIALLTPHPAVHPHHAKYHAQKIDHEAGYDSLLTAQIFIKLSAQLRDGGTSKHLGTAPLIPQPNLPPAHVQKASSSHTRFDVLQTDETSDSTGSSIPAAVSIETSRKVNNGELIPRLDAEFWKNYGNRLRVFGTEERMCFIG